jgi:hypothetical protein
MEPSEVPRRLFVIDGTWHHARTLYRDIPGLRSLPHLTLPAHLRSAFQIRRQPDVHCLSTIEAVVYALRALEPGTPGLEALLESFAAMQGRQLALARDSGRTRRQTRRHASRAIPRRLVEGYESLVVAYAESTLDPSGLGGRRLLCCAASKPATGERFHRVLYHPNLSDAHLAHVGLCRDAVEGGASAGEFQRDWSNFLGVTDNLAAWNHGTLGLLCHAAGAPPAGVSLKATYHNLKRFRGSLEDVVRLEALGGADPAPRGASPAAPGRAGARLENAVQLARFLHDRGCGAGDSARGASSPDDTRREAAAPIDRS